MKIFVFTGFGIQASDEKGFRPVRLSVFALALRPQRWSKKQEVAPAKGLNRNHLGRKPKPIKAQIAAGDPRKKGVHKLEQQLAAEPKPRAACLLARTIWWEERV